MEIVIDIPEGLKDVFENRTVTALDVEEMRMAIKKGTPLPKGHGDLIDRDSLELDSDKTLPPVTSKTRWIPCSERLPEEDGFYLATCDGEICGEDQSFTGFAEFENGKWVDDEDDYQCVLAWMPLPKPYKAESEE